MFLISQLMMLTFYLVVLLEEYEASQQDKLFFVVLAERVLEADEADSKVDTIGALKDGYVDSSLLVLLFFFP